MDQSNPCFYTKDDLTKPHLATRSNIFSNVCAKSLKCIEAIVLYHFFQRDTSFVTVANETGGKYESGRVASPESVPGNKNGIHSTHLWFHNAGQGRVFIILGILWQIIMWEVDIWNINNIS